MNILSDLQTQRKTGSQKNDEIIKQLKSLKLEAEAYHSKWNADYLVANFCKVTGIGIIFVCAMIIAPMTLESSSDFVGALAAFGFGSAAGIATVLSGVYFSNEADKRFGHVTRNVVAKIKELICRISTEFSDLGTSTLSFWHP